MKPPHIIPFDLDEALKADKPTAVNGIYEFDVPVGEIAESPIILRLMLGVQKKQFYRWMYRRLMAWAKSRGYKDLHEHFNKGKSE